MADGGEPTEFKNLFQSWPVPQASGKAYISGGKIGRYCTVYSISCIQPASKL